MDMFQNPLMAFPGITPEEMSFINQGSAELTEEQKKFFFTVYSSKRKNPQEILLLTLLGFIGVAGVQRFVIGQIGMGLLYFFTGGFCLIGTIVDLVNHKTLAEDYNRKMAYESFQMAKMSVV